MARKQQSNTKKASKYTFNDDGKILNPKTKKYLKDTEKNREMIDKYMAEEAKGKSKGGKKETPKKGGNSKYTVNKEGKLLNPKTEKYIKDTPKNRAMIDKFMEEEYTTLYDSDEKKGGKKKESKGGKKAEEKKGKGKKKAVEKNENNDEIEKLKALVATLQKTVEKYAEENKALHKKVDKILEMLQKEDDEEEEDVEDEDEGEDEEDVEDEEEEGEDEEDVEDEEEEGEDEEDVEDEEEEEGEVKKNKGKKVTPKEEEEESDDDTISTIDDSDDDDDE